MKPDFALNLSHEGAELLQRGASGWASIGAVRFDQPDLDKALKDLRAAASEQVPDGLFTKLVIPAAELRYVTVLAPGPTDEARRLQIEAEIDGLTPYGIDELVYDYVVEGDYALVVLTAREILDQAEEFAANHGFNPVAFVAIPERGAFHGEPFLGETRLARSLLPAGERVMADVQPLQMVGAQSEQEARPAIAAGASVGARARRGRAAPAAPVPPSRPGQAPSRPRVEITPRPAPPASATPFPSALGSDDGEGAGGLARVGDLVRRMGKRLRREREAAEPETADLAAGPDGNPAAEAAAPRPDVTPAPAGGETRASASGPAPKSSTTALRFRAGAKSVGRSNRPAPVSGGGGSTAPDADGEAGEAQGSAAAPIAFSTRRKPSPGRPNAASTPRLASANRGDPAGKPGPGGRLAMLPAAARAGGSDAAGALGRLVGGTRERIGKGLRRMGEQGKGLVARAGPSAAGSATAAPEKAPAAGSIARVAPGGDAQAAGRGTGPTTTTGPSTGTHEPIVPGSRPPADELAKASEAESLTIFGARGNTRPEPLAARKGLLAAGGVFLLLAAVAVWALFFDMRRDDPAAPGLAQVEPDQAAGQPGISAPGDIATPGALPDPDAAPAPPVAEEAADPATDPAAAPATDDPAALLEELVRDGLREAEPAEILDDTAAAAPTAETGTPDAGTDQASGPAEPAQPGDTPSVSETATAAQAQRLALPAPLERPAIDELMPVSAPPPPPPGVEFELGDDGLVEATPEGTLSPLGVLVYARRPDAVPPERPAGIAPEPPAPAPEAQAAPEPAPEPAALPDDTPRADPALAGFRPEPRSARVEAMAAEAAETTAPEQSPEATPEAAEPDAAQPDPDDSSALNPPGAIAITSLRPQQRPTDLVPPTRAATTTEIDLTDATREAVARSLIPSARPDDMSERVREALAAARSSPQTASRPAASTPQVRGSDAPQLPTSASVAERATERGLNLRRVNLIGVYGTSSDRRALVRLANGRIVRVGVGDALDGGQVSAIGESELRYVRRGRNQVLRIGGRG